MLVKFFEFESSNGVKKNKTIKEIEIFLKHKQIKLCGKYKLIRFVHRMKLENRHYLLINK